MTKEEDHLRQIIDEETDENKLKAKQEETEQNEE